MINTIAWIVGTGALVALISGVAFSAYDVFSRQRRRA